MTLFESLRLWVDPVEREGPEAMAVDEWLLETAASPVLRIYRWLGNWASVGYFGALGDARAALPDVRWVRRWTGGGTVDHRADWTYTVVAPTGEPLTQLRGAESYRMVHTALAEALVHEGIDARLSSGDDATGAALCFENPVSYDLVGHDGRKLAGAGQRRTQRGLLHQGSVTDTGKPIDFARRAESLAGCLAQSWTALDCQPPSEIIAKKIAARYGREAWTERR
ncbi:MAG: hypothetical protein RLZZ282_1285 [Verrucomicrobiota bacterium]